MCSVWFKLATGFPTKLLIRLSCELFFFAGARGSQEIVSGSCCEADEEDANLNGEMQTLGGNLVKNKKLKFRDFGNNFSTRWNKIGWNDLCLILT